MSKEERVVEGKATEDSHGVKRPLPVGVHSPNDWEHANLGDDQRKNKFLKLMGAGKKEHHGRIVIGEKESKAPNTRSEEEDQEVRHNLLEQYTQSLESKVTGASRRHAGFGFSDGDQHEKKQDESAARPEPEGCDNSVDTSADDAAKAESEKCETETNKDTPASPTPTGFVKSSS